MIDIDRQTSSNPNDRGITVGWNWDIIPAVPNLWIPTGPVPKKPCAPFRAKRQIYEENFGSNMFFLHVFNMFSTRSMFLDSRDHLDSVCRLLTPFVGSCVSAFIVGEVSCMDDETDVHAAFIIAQITVKGTEFNCSLIVLNQNQKKRTEIISSAFLCVVCRAEEI